MLDASLCIALYAAHYTEYNVLNVHCLSVFVFTGCREKYHLTSGILFAALRKDNKKTKIFFN